MTELILEITNRCPYLCPWCSSNATPDGEHLSYERIIEAIDSFEKIDIIKISGGEPLLHPRIGDIILYCESKTSNVWLNSNLVKQLIYNTHIVKEVKVEANVLLVPGEESHTPESVKFHVLKLVPQGRASDYKEVCGVVSHNWERDESHNCENCDTVTLRADGKLVGPPCKKYREENDVK